MTTSRKELSKKEEQQRFDNFYQALPEDSYLKKILEGFSEHLENCMRDDYNASLVQEYQHAIDEEGRLDRALKNREETLAVSEERLKNSRQFREDAESKVKALASELDFRAKRLIELEKAGQENEDLKVANCKQRIEIEQLQRDNQQLTEQLRAADEETIDGESALATIASQKIEIEGMKYDILRLKAKICDLTFEW